MKKLHIVITIILQLVVSDFLKDTHQTLHISQDISNNLTFQEWIGCYLNEINPNQNYFKSNLDNAYDQFFQLTSNEPENENQYCKDYYQYQQSAKGTDLLNANNYFTECFMREEILNLRRQSDQFYKNFYAPIFLQCTHKTNDYYKKRQNSQTITIREWHQCQLQTRHLNPYLRSCQYTDDYQETQQQFFKYLESTIQFKKYIAQKDKFGDNYPLNNNNYYLNSYLSLQSYLIAKSNSCFYLRYVFLYGDCAGY